MQGKRDKEPNEVVLTRLNMERKNWRKNHPFGFVAKPIKRPDGTLDMLKWNCKIPGPKGTIWEAGTYNLSMEFPMDYPIRPPKCQFKPVLPHPNIYPSGTVCLSILNDEEDWKSSITIKQILEGIQKLIRDEPNIESPAQYEPCHLYRTNKPKYIENAKAFAAEQKRKL